MHLVTYKHRAYTSFIHLPSALVCKVSPFNPLSAKLTKWPNTQTIHQQFANKLFECVWTFYGIGVLKG